MEKPEIVKFLEDAEIGKEYKTTTWFRCMNIQDFVEKVEKDNKIVGVIFSGNNLGFIIDENTSNGRSSRSSKSD